MSVISVIGQDRNGRTTQLDGQWNELLPITFFEGTLIRRIRTLEDARERYYEMDKKDPTEVQHALDLILRLIDELWDDLPAVSR